MSLNAQWKINSMAWSRTNRNSAWVLLLQIICKEKTELSHPLTFKFFIVKLSADADADADADAVGN